MTVEVFSWNPVRPVLSGRIGRRIPWRAPVNNFGDLLGPMIVDQLIDRRGLDRRRGTARLFTVGSVYHFTDPGDWVWGSGINGKVMTVEAVGRHVCAVRGPRTRDVLTAQGADVPEVFGDPALLWPLFWPRSTYIQPDARKRPVTIVPNLHDWNDFKRDERAISPRAPVHEVIGRIVNSDLVVGSSLHGVILADAFGVPARFVAAGREPPFKYADYLAGSGRTPYAPAADAAQAIRTGGHPALDWDPQPLLDAFPAHLWN